MSKHRLLYFGILSAAVFALGTSAASAEMYKWINEDGTTTFSNQPPTDAASVHEFTTIEVPKAEPLPPAVKTYPSQTSSSIIVEPTASKNDSEVPPARASVRSNMPLAVQDPCLRSSDRLCYQKNKDKYRPYVGYTPYETPVAEVQPVVPPARGATSGASAGGAVGGGIRVK